MNGAALVWGAHAPRVLVSAPPPKQSFLPGNKVRDREGAIANTRGRVCSPIL